MTKVNLFYTDPRLYIACMAKLTRAFYERDDVVQIARELLGKVLVTRIDNVITAGRITETEAYNGRTDKASHAFQKRTPRTEVMYGEGGLSYVYLIYGIHHLFNVVTNVKGLADAVLIRAVEPVDGLDTMAMRRQMDKGHKRLTSGPGTLAKAMGIRGQHNALKLTGDTIWIEEAPLLKPNEVTVSTRIGVDYAGDDAHLPWRFYETQSRYVSKR